MSTATSSPKMTDEPSVSMPSLSDESVKAKAFEHDARQTMPSDAASLSSHKAHADPKATDASILPEVESLPQASQDVEKGAGPPAGNPMMDPKSFPDGGWSAWLCCVGGFCCLFCSFGWINTVGVFQDYYQTHMLKNYSSSTVSWIPSLEVFMMFFGGPFIGKLYDNYGPRGILFFGSLLHVFGVMMTSLCKEYYQFILAQGICSPIGTSMIFYAGMSSLTTWFFRKRALAFGIMAAGSSIGGIIFPIMTDHLIESIGFGWAMRVSGFLMLGLLVIANLTVKSRIPPMPKPFQPVEFLLPFTEPTFVLLTIGAFLFFMGMFIPINYLIVQATAEGMSTRLAAYIIPILNALSLFGRVLPGYVGDKIGRFNVMIVLCLATGILDLALWIPASSNAALIVFAAAYGFGSGAFVSMLPACIAQISDVRKIGVRTGSMFAAISIAALISNPIGGQIVSAENGSFTGLKIFCGVMQISGALVIGASRVSAAGINLKKKV